MRRRWCRLFGHRRRWFVSDPTRPDDVTIGCPRCKDPSTFETLVRADDDPTNPGYVRVAGFDKLWGFMEGHR